MKKYITLSLVASAIPTTSTHAAGTLASAGEALVGRAARSIANYMSPKVIEECTQASYNGAMSFPQVVGALNAIGVERYDVDLVSLRKLTYGKDSDSLAEDLTAYMKKRDIAAVFNLEAIRMAIAEIQKGESTYPLFLDKIMDAGVSHYEVYIDGRRVHYIGRSGDIHTEHFPPKPLK